MHRRVNLMKKERRRIISASERMYDAWCQIVFIYQINSISIWETYKSRQNYCSKDTTLVNKPHKSGSYKMWKHK